MPMNSRPNVNEDLRKTYRDIWGHDEVFRYLPDILTTREIKRLYDPWLSGKLPTPFLNAMETHHIYQAHSGGPKCDVWSNFISLHRGTHDWCHANPQLGKIACLWAKFRKSRVHDPMDFVVDELRLASGKNFPECLDVLSLSGVPATWRREIVNHFSRKGT